MHTQTFAQPRETAIFARTIGMIISETRMKTPNLDGMALNLFRDRGVECGFKRMAIVLTYKAIQENKNISAKTLKWVLGKYNVKPQDVEAALAALKNVFKSVRSWQPRGNASANIHWVAVDNVPKMFAQWLEQTLLDNPELAHYDTANSNANSKY